MLELTECSNPPQQQPGCKLKERGCSVLGYCQENG